MTFRQSIVGLILPLTIVSFGTFTKWWYVQPVDAPDTMMVGFPLPFVCDGWHTSMSLQIFVVELFIDFLVYFAFSLLFTLFIGRWLTRTRGPKIVTGTLWTLATIVLTMAVMIASMPEQVIQLKRNWDMEVLASGYKLTWMFQDRPDLQKNAGISGLSNPKPH